MKDHNHIYPPRLGQWLLRRMISRDIRYSAMGDFEEIYTCIVEEKGLLRAYSWYWMQVGKSVPSFISDTILWRIVMLNNYLKIALRNMRMHKGYSLINIAGLAIGMAACMLIFLWVRDELSYDRFHENADDLYRVVAEFHRTGGFWPVVSIPVGYTLKEDFPEIVNSVRCRPHECLIEREERAFTEVGAFVEPSLFSMFTFPFTRGDQETAFSNPSSIVITEEMAEKFFGDEDPMGKTLKIENETEFSVSGVLRDIPRNSHIRFDFFLPFELFLQRDRDPSNWGRFQIYTYVLLQENMPFRSVEEKITELITQHRPEAGATLHLQPLTRIHLHALGGGGNIQYVYIFSLIAAFILIIACINFTNLTTARSMARAKEVGMRKVTGAHRVDLIRQFMGESSLLCIISVLFAILLMLLLLPRFNVLSGKQFTLDLAKNSDMVLGLVGILLFTVILSGSYPAVILSAFRPINILRGQLILKKYGKRGPLFRKGLVTFQFSISIFLIISTLIITKQLDFIKNKNLGYNREQVLYFLMRGNMNQHVESIKQELLKDPSVLYASATSELPTEIGRQYRGWDWEGRKPEQDVDMGLVAVDYDFFETLNIEIVEGRHFSREFSTDEKKAYILNETAVMAMEIELPVGKWFEWGERGQIIGVVKDFHFRSLHEEIEPLVMLVEPSRFEYICAKMKSEGTDISGTIRHIENVWRQFAPDFPFEYSFLDDAFESMYRTEHRMGKIYGYFTFLAVFISCLGLFGLASFMAEQRTKEIGIRKVFGASVQGIVIHLCKEFVKWVFVANLIAGPIAYYAMRQWLQNFAYRTNIGLWSFVLSGSLALMIALLTVSYQVAKAAVANPVHSLRYE